MDTQEKQAKQYEVKITRHAEQSMREIGVYIAFDLMEPETAVKMLKTFQSEISKLATMNSTVYATLIKLCTDICKRNGKKKLLWLGDKEKTLNYSPAADEMVLTVHRWFANKSCPGNWLYARMGELAATVTAALGGSSASGLQATLLKNLSEAEAVTKIGPLFTENQKQSGILACVSMAQFILESGYGTSELAQNANNCFGMKTSL